MTLQIQLIKGHPVIVDSNNTGVPVTNPYNNAVDDIVSSNAARIALHGLGQSYTTNPTASTDSYDVGAIWTNHINRKVFVCMDNTPDNAVWLDMTSGIITEPAFAANYYVSPYGNDEGGGSFTDPFQTIQAAISAVRTNDVTGAVVAIREGEYRISSPVIFGTGDAGTQKYPKQYVAYPGESPVFKGSYLVTGVWQPTGFQDNTIYYTNLSGQAPFRTLYVDGVQAQRARFPNTGYHEMIEYNVGTSSANRIHDYFWINSGSPEYSKIPTGVLSSEIGYDGVEVFYTVGSISQVNAMSGLPTTGIHTTNYLSPGSTQWKIPIYYDDPGINYRGDYGRYYLENSMSFLNSPGEWFYNTGTYDLFYYPLSGQNISGVDVEIPNVETIFQISGSENYLDLNTSTGIRGISLWFNTTATYTDNFIESMLFMNKDAQGGSVGIEMALRQHFSNNVPACTPYLALSGSNGPYTVSGAFGDLNDGNWHHWYAVMDKKNNKLYSWIDGVKDANFANISARTCSNRPFSLGYQSSSPPSRYSGMLDELVIIKDLEETTGDVLNIMSGNYSPYNVMLRMSFDDDYSVYSDTIKAVQVKELYESSTVNVTTRSNLAFSTGVRGGKSLFFDGRRDDSNLINKIASNDIRGVSAAYINFSGIRFTQTDCGAGLKINYGDEHHDNMVGAVDLIWASNIKFNDCTFNYLNGDAINAKFSKALTVDGCVINDIGYMGIYTYADLKPNKLNGHHIFTNNHIYNVGKYIQAGNGIFHYKEGDLKILNNYIHDNPYCGIRGFNALNSLYSAGGNTEIAYNHIYNCMQKNYDGGGIMENGWNPNTTIHHNRIHDCVWTPYHILPEDSSPTTGFVRGNLRGIYCDEGSYGINIYKNLIYDISTSCIFFHLASNCIVENNKLINTLGECNHAAPSSGSISLIHRSNLPFGTGNLIYPTGMTIAKNIVYNSDPTVASLLITMSSISYWSSFIDGNMVTWGDNFYSNNNLTTYSDQGPTISGNLSISYIGNLLHIESGSMSGWAGFSDIANEDFTLQTWSPALQLGFEEFDVPDYTNRVW